MDNLPHYILRGLLRPHYLQLHRHSLHLRLPHIHYQLNILSLLHFPLCCTHFCGSHRTSISTAWPTAPAPVHEPTVPPTPFPCSPPPPRVHQPQPVATTTSTPPSTTPRHTAVKAAPKVRTDKKTEKPRRSTPTAPSTTTIDAPSAPSASPSVQQDLASLHDSTTRGIGPHYPSPTADDT